MRSAVPRSAALGLAAALALAACTDDTGDAATTTTTTTEAALVCPDGSRPDAAPPPPPPAAPTTGTDPDRSAAPRDGVLDVGVLLPRTGDLAFLAPPAAAAADLAATDVEAAGGVLGAPISLHPADSAPEVAGQAEAEVDRLLAAGVDVLVGPITSGVSARVLERVRAAGSVVVSPGSTATGLDVLDTDGRLFRTAPTDDLQGRALAELALEDGARTASLVVRADRYGRTIADAFTTRFAGDDGQVTSRVEYDPTAEDLADTAMADLATDVDAIVIVGLAESARVLEALAEAGEGPGRRLVYGTDGNLGDRLADLVDDPSSLACLRGLLPVATPDASFAARLAEVAPGLAGTALDHAVETYDAVVVAALAAQVAGADDAGAVAAEIRGVTRGGEVCRTVDGCLRLAAQGADLAYVGASGPSALDPDGNRTAARLTEVAFDGDGRLRRLGDRAVPR